MTRSLACALATSAALALAAAAEEPVAPLVDMAWLKERVCDAGVVVLDLRRSAANFKAEHIPCAVHSDYYNGGWRASANGVDNMIPPPQRLAELIGGLGIGNDTHVVLVTAAVDAFSAAELTRVYMIFRYLGHDRVSILEGGLAAWTDDWENDIDSGPSAPQPVAFAVRPRADVIVGRAEVEAALAGGTIPLIDMRANDHYLGINVTPVVRRHGTVPGARNLPMSWIVVDEGLRFRAGAALGRLWRAAGVAADGPQILFCNTGLESSVGWFAAFALLGNEAVRLYDGSLAEWSADATLPMEVKVVLD
jgi:thiosulfate/3-mercaptopyruvate sulfurtransferase